MVTPPFDTVQVYQPLGASREDYTGEKTEGKDKSFDGEIRLADTLCSRRSNGRAFAGE